jgi:hypothetical protein
MNSEDATFAQTLTAEDSAAGEDVNHQEVSQVFLLSLDMSCPPFSMKVSGSRTDQGIDILKLVHAL